MRVYRFFHVLSFFSLGLVIVFSLVALFRYSLPYNYNGVYVDEWGKAMYHQQSADIFAGVAVCFFVVFVINGFLYRKYKA